MAYIHPPPSVFVYLAKEEESFIRRNILFKMKNHLQATRLEGKMPETLAQKKLTFDLNKTLTFFSSPCSLLLAVEEGSR
jgi:hypothetical protein